ncbi:hypothetical protein LCGC14_1842430 [marine sediment metagenome]|uniref:Homologous-pairing protein 2 winged helix domain-containing protein n=1 Tax=marine sediment metagenome TaxID=412755 RepID=A0A0F9ISD0_9ZZZZ
MRKKGDFEYTEEHEEFILRAVKERPQTTNAITKDVRKKFFRKIDPNTVKRILKNLFKQGKIKRFQSGRTMLWQR